jgi:hypothetical protein
MFNVEWRSDEHHKQYPGACVRICLPRYQSRLITEAEEIVAILTTIVKNAGKSSSRGHSTFSIQQ